MNASLTIGQLASAVGVNGAKIKQLKRLRTVLQRLAGACQAREHTGECPILEALEDHVPGNT